MLQNDKHLGEKYEIVRVKPIFARNVLFPNKIAILADKEAKNNYAQKMEAAKVSREKKAASLEDLFSKIGGHMPAIDLSYSDEDECYFKNEEMWNKYDPITIAKNHDVKNIKIYLDDGNEDEGKFYLSCEKLYSVLKEKSVDVEYNLFKGHHNAEYILSNIENYLKFYNS